MSAVTDRSLQHALDGLASRQHGAYAPWQSLALGLTDGGAGRRIAAGSLVRRGSGVYVDPSHARSVRQDLMVAVLQAGPGAVAGFYCSCALHHLPDFHLGSHGLEVLVPYGKGTRLARAHVRRTRCLPPEHVTVVDGIPCTSMARTVADMAMLLSPRPLGRLVDDALLRRRLTVPQVDAVLGALPSVRPGTRQLRSVLDARRPDAYVPPESELEARVFESIVDAGLPTPILQAPPPWRTKEGQRVDFTSEDSRLIIEGDGRAWHARMEALQRDARRSRLAAAHGYLVVPVTWEDVTTFRDDLLVELAAIHARRLRGIA